MSINVRKEFIGREENCGRYGQLILVSRFCFVCLLYGRATKVQMEWNVKVRLVNTDNRNFPPPSSLWGYG